MAYSMQLNKNWDISLDSNGNFSMADGDYAVAQNAACACRAFVNDMYFNQSEGIPHFSTDISNKSTVNPTLLAYFMEKEAKKFPEIKGAKLTDLAIENRLLTGKLELTLETGRVIYVTI